MLEDIKLGYDKTIEDNEFDSAISTENERYTARMNDIMGAPDQSATPLMIASNNDFLRAWGAENTVGSSETDYKVYRLQEETARHEQALNQIKERFETEDQTLKKQREDETKVQIYRAYHAGFDFIGQLGAVSQNRTLAMIGAIGGGGVAVAFNYAVLTGKIAVTGMTTVGWGVFVPFFGMLMGGLTIAGALLAKKNNNNQGEGLQFLAELQIKLSKLILERIDQMEGNLVDRLREMAYLSIKQAAILKVMVSDQFEALFMKADNLQADLNHLSELAKNGRTGEYLKDYHILIREIEKYSGMNRDEGDIRTIKNLLIKLSIWLTDRNIMSNLNTHWCMTKEINAKNLFTNGNLRHHDRILNGELENRLGYLASLGAMIPGVDLKKIKPELIPCPTQFARGVGAYVEGRFQMGILAAKSMDLKNETIDEIQAVAQLGLLFMKSMRGQERNILGGLLNQYEFEFFAAYQHLEAQASAKLIEGVVPGFQKLTYDIINDKAPWPEKMIPPATYLRRGYDHGYQELPLGDDPELNFKVLVDNLVKQDQPPKIDRLVQQAINLGIGQVKASYSLKMLKAHGDPSGFGGHRVTWGYKYERQIDSLMIVVVYEISGKTYPLFTVESALSKVKLAESLHCNTRDHAHGIRSAAHYQTECDANQNLQPIKEFLSAHWGVDITIPKAVSNTEEPSDELRAAIVNQIVRRCIIAPLSDGDSIESKKARTSILKKLSEAPALLGDLPAHLGFLKNLLMRYAVLMNTPLIPEIQALWNQDTAKSSLSVFRTLQHHIDTLRDALTLLDPSTEREQNVIVMYFEYCHSLLGSLKKYEQSEGFKRQMEVADRLQVSARIVLDPAMIKVEKIKENHLGSGSFGEVYKGLDLRDKSKPKEVAVKLLFSGTTLLPGDLLVAEHLVHAKNPSPYLTLIYGVTELGNQQAIVMEMVKNGTLSDQLHKRKPGLSVESRAQIAREILAALFYLHHLKILHCDLKADNVLIDEQGHAKLADYGLASCRASTHATSNSIPSDKPIKGTLPYRAPELFRYDSSGDHTDKTDVFALGMIFYEIMTNLAPYHQFKRKDFETIQAYWGSMLNDPVNTPKIFDVPAPPESASVGYHNLFRLLSVPITECLAVNPQNRPDTQALINKMGHI